MAGHHNIKAVRKLLTKHSDGLTPNQVEALIGMRYSTAYNVMRRLPDMYIDRYFPNPETLQWNPVFCLVQPPLDSPKPRIKVSAYLSQVAA